MDHWETLVGRVKRKLIFIIFQKLLQVFVSLSKYFQLNPRDQSNFVRHSICHKIATNL